MTMVAETIDQALTHWAIDGSAATAAEAEAALATRPLLVLMHGFGSFEGDLIGLAPGLPKGFVCASPRAPLIAPPPIVNGFSWWPLRMTPDGTVLREPPPEEFVGSGPHRGATAVLEWLDALESRVEGGLPSIAIMGFSQGGCLVTSLLRLRPERFTCGVNCSGFVAPGSFEGDRELTETLPPMFWGYDPADPVIGPERIAELAEWGPRHTTLEARSYPGIAHSISGEELADISAFLARQVPEASTSGRVDGVAT